MEAFIDELSITLSNIEKERGRQYHKYVELKETFLQGRQRQLGFTKEEIQWAMTAHSGQAEGLDYAIDQLRTFLRNLT